MATNFYEGQRVRIIADVEGQSTRGRLATLDFYVEPNSDEPVWCATLDNGTHIDLFVDEFVAALSDDPHYHGLLQPRGK